MAKQRPRTPGSTTSRAERPRRPRRLFVEQLEPRTMLAGDSDVVPVAARFFDLEMDPAHMPPESYRSPKIGDSLAKLAYDYDHRDSDGFFAVGDPGGPAFEVTADPMAGSYVRGALFRNCVGVDLTPTASIAANQNVSNFSFNIFSGQLDVPNVHFNAVTGHFTAWVPLGAIASLSSLPGLAFADLASLPPPPPQPPIVQFTLQLTDLAGSPLTNLASGQEFILHTYTNDVRASDHGVAAAYLNIQWDRSLATVEGPLGHSALYSTAKTGDTSQAGEIQNAGGCVVGWDAGTGPLEVFSVRMKATAAGNLIFMTRPAEQLTPVHYTIVYVDARRVDCYDDGTVPPSKISFGRTSIAVASPALIASPSPAESPPTVALPPASEQPPDVRATVEITTTDLTGNPIMSIEVGQDFEMRAYLILTAPATVQPMAGYADVTYASSLIVPAANANDVGLVGSTVSNGLMDGIGQVMYGDSSGLMFIKTFTATTKGTATFAASRTDEFGHEIYVSGLIDPLPWSQVAFGSTTLTIKP